MQRSLFLFGNILYFICCKINAFQNTCTVEEAMFVMPFAFSLPTVAGENVWWQKADVEQLPGVFTQACSAFCVRHHRQSKFFFFLGKHQCYKPMEGNMP